MSRKAVKPKQAGTRNTGWRKYPVYRHLLALLCAAEPRQYAAFLSVWYFLRGFQWALRVASISFAFLLYIGDMQELAQVNFLLLLQWAFYSSLGHSLCSALLFLCAPGSRVMQGLQEYLQTKSSLRFQQSMLAGSRHAGIDDGESGRILHRIFGEKGRVLWQIRKKEWQRVWGHMQNNVCLQFQLWVKLPLASLLCLLELSLALLWGLLLYLLFGGQGFAVLS